MGFYVTGIYCILVVASSTQAEQWRWRSDERSVKSSREVKPAQSVRIDTKVRFEDSGADRELNGDEAVLFSATDSSGFYDGPSAAYNSAPVAETQGTLDDLLYCRCERAPARSLQCAAGPRKGCNTDEHLCCYSPASQTPHRSDVSNEIEAGRPSAAGPLLVGPQGPTGLVGPYSHRDTDSGESASAQRNFLFPARPSGFFNSGYNRPVLVGPGGPTGVVGPRGRGVLVGPSGPTGIIGPRRQSVLVGPGGPTGVIGPAEINGGYGTNTPGVLVGPGGPTGRVGPGRQVLVGPGGPTGQVGPRRSFGK